MPLARKILADKPSSIHDRCTDGGGHEVAASQCDAVVQAYSDPRLESGMPKADDTIKCELAPLRRSAYGSVKFSDPEWAEMGKAFPSGVCDYRKPGVDRVPTRAWQSYQDAKGRVVYGGRGLGSAPKSVALGRTCRRSFRFRLRHARGRRVVGVTVYVNGKRILRRRGHALARVSLRRIPRKRARIKIVTKQSDGSRRISTRTYRNCRKTRPRTRVRR